MTTKKLIRLGKSLKYELFLVVLNFRGLKTSQILEKLPKGYASYKTIYNYRQRLERAEKKYKELTREW